MHLWEYEVATLDRLQQESMKIRDLLGKSNPGTPMYHQLLLHLDAAEREYFNKRAILAEKDRIKREEKKIAQQNEMEIGGINNLQHEARKIAKYYLSSTNRRKPRLSRAAVLVGERYATEVHDVAIDYIIDK